MKKIIIAIVISFLTLPFLALAATPTPLPAPSYNFVNNSGLGATAEKTGHKSNGLFGDRAGQDSLEYGISIILTVVASFVAVFFLIMVVLGGFTWVTAGGNEEAIKKGKNQILNAFIGFLITVAAYSISFAFVNINSIILMF